MACKASPPLYTRTTRCSARIVCRPGASAALLGALLLSSVQQNSYAFLFRLLMEPFLLYLRPHPLSYVPLKEDLLYRYRYLPLKLLLTYSLPMYSLLPLPY